MAMAGVEVANGVLVLIQVGGHAARAGNLVGVLLPEHRRARVVRGPHARRVGAAERKPRGRAKISQERGVALRGVTLRRLGRVRAPVRTLRAIVRTLRAIVRTLRAI
eukprot:297249-Prorocentrum_minimum.AAC.1